MRRQQQPKRWFQICITCYFIMLAAIVLVVWVVDPLFHFHRPFSFLSYRLYYERYVNDGILRHFEYDTVITGTSMAQNFKTTEVDALLGGTCVKTPFSGAGYGEISDSLRRALERNDGLRTVIWSLDYNAMIRDAGWEAYDEYPTYLYDDNPFNDVFYVFNKSIWYRNVGVNILMTLAGTPSTAMDDYSAWDKETGLQYILQSYDRNHVEEDMPATLGPEEERMVRENIGQNIVALADAYPDTTFYLFYTPYSICYWDSLMQEGSMQRQFEAEQLVTELLLQCPNIRLYNFFDRHDVVTNLDNYRDKEHYAAHVNSMILEWLAEDEGLVTAENYLERLEREKKFYWNYDYEKIYQDP